jgi:hypothetical protein
VQEETHLEVRGAEIVIELAWGDLYQVLGRFGFDDEDIVNDHIQSLWAELFTFVHDSYSHLSRDAVTTRSELALECGEIKLFEVAEAENILYFEERADDAIGQFFVKQLMFRHDIPSRVATPGASPFDCVPCQDV